MRYIYSQIGLTREQWDWIDDQVDNRSRYFRRLVERDRASGRWEDAEADA